MPKDKVWFRFFWGWLLLIIVSIYGILTSIFGYLDFPCWKLNFLKSVQVSGVLWVGAGVVISLYIGNANNEINSAEGKSYKLSEKYGKEMFWLNVCATIVTVVGTLAGLFGILSD